MRVLIAGGAGFIGSHLVDHYLDAGHSVCIIDNFITGRLENIVYRTYAVGCQLIGRDICDLPLTDYPQDLDLIFHLASPASPRDYLRYPLATMKTAACGTRNLLELAWSHRARFVLASTSEIYGDPLEHPQKETYWGNVNPVGPRSVYDESKRYAEALTCAYHRKHGVNTAIARIFNTYGPRMRQSDGRLIPQVIEQLLSNKPVTIYGDGRQTRSCCYVSDTVRGLVALAESDHHEPINIGNPDERSVLEITEAIKQLLGTSTPFEFDSLPQDDPVRRRPDITRAREVLGWSPSVPLEQGLQITIDSFRIQQKEEK